MRLFPWFQRMNAFSLFFWLRRFQAFAAIFRWVSGATVVVMSETPAIINIIFVFSQRWGFYYSFGYCRRESSSLFFVGFGRWGNLYLCGVWQWRYILKLQYIRFPFFSLLTVVFLTPWFVNFFFTFFIASTTTYGHFHQNVSSGIFAHWFSLNQIFKFSVRLRKKETDHRMDVLIEVFARQNT